MDATIRCDIKLTERHVNDSQLVFYDGELCIARRVRGDSFRGMQRAPGRLKLQSQVVGARGF
jgi:hypothetical protein